MAKILIVNCVYDPEPIVSAQLGKSLAEKLSNNGHLVSVIAPFPSRPFGFSFNNVFKKGCINEEIINDRLVIYRLPSFTYPKSGLLGRLFESVSFGWAAFKYVTKNSTKIDKVYVNTWPLFGQFGVALACKKKEIEYFMHIQDIYPESLTNKLPKVFKRPIHMALMLLEKYALFNASRIIVISKKMGTYIAQTRGISSSKIEVVLNWQDESTFENYKEVWCPDKLTFMYLGNIGPVCGLPDVIKSFVEAKVNAKLILAGNGSKKDECIEIAKLHPELDIEFWDVPVGEVAKIQSYAHVLLLPLIKGAASSSIPSKLPAYMFSAKPIIATLDEDSDTADVIRTSSCGWVGPPEDGDWLKSMFSEVSLMDAALLREKGQSGRVYALNAFSRTVNLEKIIHTIEYDK